MPDDSIPSGRLSLPRPRPDSPGDRATPDRTSADRTSADRVSTDRTSVDPAHVEPSAPRQRAVVWTRVDHADLVAAARHGFDAFGRGIRRDHNPFALTMFVARVRGARAVLLCVQAAAWWVGWDDAAERLD